MSLHFLALQVGPSVSRSGERFRGGQCSLVSFLFAVLTTHGAPDALPFVKEGGRAPRSLWSRRHWNLMYMYV